MPVKDRTGQRFGKLVVIERAPVPDHVKGKSSRVYWRCQHDDGEERIVRTDNLYWTDTRTPTQRSWDNMIERTSGRGNPKDRHIYADRGITVCERWRTFANFLEDMGEKPEGRTLDRKDGDKGYYKANCQWATPTEQAQNTRSNVNVEIDGVTHCVSEWARRNGINIMTAFSRIRRGWTAEDAVTIPTGQRRAS